MEMEFERIKPLVGFDVQENKYFISESGMVIRRSDNRVMGTEMNNAGYIRVRIDGKRYFVHRLVAYNFIDKPDDVERLQVNHDDGDKTNNHYTNLEWSTPSENQKHAYRIGLSKGEFRAAGKIPIGSASVHAKVTEELVEKICQLIEDGISNKEIKSSIQIDELDSTQYNSLLHHLRKRNSWHHITKKYSY